MDWSFAVTANTTAAQSQRQNTSLQMYEKYYSQQTANFPNIFSSITEHGCHLSWVSQTLSVFQLQVTEMLEINMNGERRLHLQNCCQTFSRCSEAYMWQCQSQYISSCTQAGWCNPDLWLRHMASAAHIFADMLQTVTVWMLQCVFFLLSLTAPVNQSLVSSSCPADPSVSCWVLS